MNHSGVRIGVESGLAGPHPRLARTALYMGRFLIATALLALAIPVSAQSAAGDETSRLAGLGQVWGFLKYYHPGVASGTIDWDSTLVATVPAVRRARTGKAYNRVLLSLIDAAGPIPVCGNCQAESPNRLLHNADLAWMDNTRLFTPAVIERLAHVRDNRHQGAGRYVSFTQIGTPSFDADTAYASPSYPAEAVRLLTLFRYWNAIQYYFPYRYVNDGDWNDVLPGFVPHMLKAANEEEYHLRVLELTTRVRDTHVTTMSPVLTRSLGPRTPAFTARSVEGEIIVTKLMEGMSADGGGLLPGDVITHIDGVPVTERRAALSRYVAAGNPATFERNLVRLVLRGSADSVTYTVLRAGEQLQRRVAMAPQQPPAEPGAPRQLPVYPVSDLVKVLPGNIGYINMGDIERTQVDSALAIVRGTSGIIMDVRNYPRGTLYAFASYLNPEARPFAVFTIPEPGWPGGFQWTQPVRAGPQSLNPDRYVGRIAILVDERSQSHSEFSVMALQTAPENRVIGSQTAGADGNIVFLSLPGGVRTIFTGLGVYYPDGRQTQRIGIIPDIEVRPTIEGLQAGRDEVLERAMEYIRTGA